MPRSGTVRILLVDDHRIVRAGLRLLLEAEPGFVVVGDAGTVAEAEEVLATERPDVALVDLSLPGRSGIDLVRRLRAEGVQVIVVTMHDDAEHLRAVVEAGGAGYVVKHAADTELITAIRTVLEGRSYYSLSLDQLPTTPVRRALDPRLALLSPRERAVLVAIARGRTNAEIAEELTIGVKTVETHRTNIAAKTGERTRTGLARLAIEAGLLENR